MKRLKKSLAFITTISMLATLSACNSDNSSKEETTTEATTEAVTEIQTKIYNDSPYNIYAYFKENFDFIGDYIEYDEETDPNESLGKNGSYIAKLNFEITYIDQSSDVTPDLGASIEIFKNNDDAKTRSDYLNGLTITKNQGNYVCENVVLRITEQAKAKDMSSLNDALLKFMQSPQKYEKPVDTDTYELDLTLVLNDISYNINKNWIQDTETDDAHRFLLPDNSSFSISVISDSSYSYTDSDLTAFAEMLKSNGDISNYQFTTIDNQNAIYTTDSSGSISYFFIANGSMYSVIFIQSADSDASLRTEIIESIKINKTQENQNTNTIYESLNETIQDKQTPSNENNNSVIYEDETVQITYTGIEKDLSFGWTDVKLTIENKSDKKICVQDQDVSINGVMTDPIFSCEITRGKKANDIMTFTHLEEDGIDKIETIELSFHIFDYDSRDTIIDTEPITIDVSK